MGIENYIFFITRFLTQLHWFDLWVRPQSSMNYLQHYNVFMEWYVL